jgi:hypothetical protein
MSVHSITARDNRGLTSCYALTGDGDIFLYFLFISHCFNFFSWGANSYPGILGASMDEFMCFPSPTKMKSLSGRGIIKLAIHTADGPDYFHAIALSSTGQYVTSNFYSVTYIKVCILGDIIQSINLDWELMKDLCLLQEKYNFSKENL